MPPEYTTIKMQFGQLSLQIVTDLAKITRVVLIEVDPMVVHTTGITSSTRVLAVFTYLTKKSL